MPASGRPVPPFELSPETQKVWDQVVEELDAMKIAARADAYSIQVLCEELVTWRRATELLRGSDVLIKGSRGQLVPNPLIAIQRRSANVILRFSQEFALTPASRTRVDMNHPLMHQPGRRSHGWSPFDASNVRKDDD